eukprot:CAMPEP_0182931644 /NCGR_PEP_ID=MMETSP0105_2-20130417/29018_1 /TAXON_ID=81532 ORGANISM="Acanthoeca-like sp., Strain 10tr" /NCGR_SAMPLE_ID=MMETSP0105_2 /ASSEMBLY_ACC=CAM_ASM_000205 /LENGTH=433 /DNA_ID=CAMNT_0025070117 /DNA_START=43 /DNA_END=1344 /DNA_ORIENTATION=+
MAGLVDRVISMADRGETPKDLAKALYRHKFEVSPDMLQAMSPQLHSLGWLEVLHVMGSTIEDGAPAGHFVTQCNRFFLECTPAHIRASPIKFSELVSRYTAVVVDAEALRSVHPLKVAVEKLRVSPEHLTPIHAEFAKVALKARCAHVLRQVLDVDIVYFGDGTDESYRLPITCLLLYYYYGGAAYLSLKQYDRAMQFFSVVISAPAEQVSSIMIEAYKKYVLTSLLHYGKMVELPSYASHALRQVKTASTEYKDLITAYQTRDATQFIEVVAKYSDVLAADKNLGLAVHCHDSITRRNIRRLTEMFLTMTLSAIAERVKLRDAAEAEQALVRMIDSGEIHASIDQVTGTVSFHDDEEKFDTEDSLAMLHSQVEETAAQHQKLVELDEELRTAKQYIRKTEVAGDAAAGAAGDFDLGVVDAPGMGPMVLDPRA